MSATLDGAMLSSLLGNAPVISTSGRQFPVKHHYYNFDPEAHIPVRMARAIRKALLESTGDILAFLPGASEIRRTQTLLEAENIGAVVYALYGDLPMKKQQEAILPLPGKKRKVVLATSIAETSLTIEGITVVVDCGYSRVPRFDPRSGLTRLETIRVTRDAADQRAGRAGRMGPGVCYRLWGEGMNASLVLHRSPEILDADLAPVILELGLWGVNEVRELTWITPPPAGAVSQAKELLKQLEAIDEGRITDRGKQMLQLPTHPRIAHMLLISTPTSPSPPSNRGSAAPIAIGAKVGGEVHVALATDIAALLEEKDPLPREAGADLTLRLEVLRKWRRGEKVNAEINSLERIERLAESWRRVFKIAVTNSAVADEEVGKLLAAAYPERIARQEEINSERYKLANGRVVQLPRHDPLVREPWLSVAHLDAGTARGNSARMTRSDGDRVGREEGKIFLAAPLNEEELYALAQQHETVRWDAGRGMVVGAVEKRIGNVVLETKPLAVISQEKRIRVLCEAVRAEGLKIMGWSEDENQWQARVMSLRSWRPGEGWPDVTDEHLLNSLIEWLSPYLVNASKRTDLQRLDRSTILAGMISWNLASRLDTLAPAKLEVPSGSLIPLLYGLQGQPPVMEVRLQEVFGLLETPSVNEGKTKVILHLLSPGYKPVQVTQDLKSFWQTAYHEVRKELRIRYRKHSWPEDPWTARAVRGVKKSRQ